jgi:hypothetical protein
MGFVHLVLVIKMEREHDIADAVTHVKQYGIHPWLKEWSPRPYLFRLQINYDIQNNE